VIGDRRGQRVQWSGVGDALVRSMPVAEGFELPERVEKVSLVPDEGAVQEFAAAGLYPPFHDRVHARYPHSAEHDLDAGVGEDGVEQGGELPVAVPVMNRARQSASSRSMTRFFAVCVTQDAVGCAVAPRIRIRRLACSITANTYNRAPDKVTV
jgi:hypothetical protein